MSGLPPSQQQDQSSSSQQSSQSSSTQMNADDETPMYWASTPERAPATASVTDQESLAFPTPPSSPVSTSSTIVSDESLPSQPTHRRSGKLATMPVDLMRIVFSSNSNLKGVDSEDQRSFSRTIPAPSLGSSYFQLASRETGFDLSSSSASSILSCGSSSIASNSTASPARTPLPVIQEAYDDDHDDESSARTEVYGMETYNRHPAFFHP